MSRLRPDDLVARVGSDLGHALLVKCSRHLFWNLIGCRDISQHPRLRFEVRADQVLKQPLVNVLLVVDAVGLHNCLQVRLEHAGDLNGREPDHQFEVTHADQ